MLKYFEYQPTKRCLEGGLEGFSYVSLWFLKIMWLVEYQIARKCRNFHHCCRWLHHYYSWGCPVCYTAVFITNGCWESNHIPFPWLANKNAAPIFWKVFVPRLWYGDSSNHSFAFIGAPCEWQNNQNPCVKTSNQLEWCCRSRVLFKIYEISSGSKWVEQMWCTL